MSHKIKIALVISTIAALLVVGVAAAKGGPNDGGGKGKGQGGAVGQVVAVEGNQITVEKLDGTQVVIQVNDDTRYFVKDSEDEVSLADIEVGMWIGGRAEEDDDGNRVARAIVILPDDFDPEAARDGAGTRGAGTVVSVSGDSVTVETADGETLVLAATADTRFGGKDGSSESLSDLEAGDTVGFAYSEADDGTLELLAIGESRPAGTRGAGTVVSVSGDSVTIETADGETLVLTATTDTCFGGKNGSIESLSDLEAGDTVGFAYSEADDGTLELLAIGVGGGGRGGPGAGGNGFGGSAEG